MPISRRRVTSAAPVRAHQGIFRGAHIQIIYKCGKVANPIAIAESVWAALAPFRQAVEAGGTRGLTAVFREFS